MVDSCLDPSVHPRTAQRMQRMRAVLTQRQFDLTLVLANIHDPHNVSAIYRSADAFGVSAIHLYYTDTAFPQLSKKTSASARKWVETIRHSSLEDLCGALTNHQILVTGFSEKARALRSWDLTRPTAIIMGNEHKGVAFELAQIAHGELYIPMHGMIQSFNVSVAAAIILAEAARQREEKGMYATSRLDAESFKAKLEEWEQK